jgi:hypothetical protein
MPLQDENWNTIHASAFSHARALMRPATATLRPHGGVRYRCPVTGSFVLVTDEPTLAALARPHARLRCADCGEMHLMTIAAEDPVVATTDD